MKILVHLRIDTLTVLFAIEDRDHGGKLVQERVIFVRRQIICDFLEKCRIVVGVANIEVEAREWGCHVREKV